LLTLSLIHYARWVILRAGDFPRLDPSQPEEDLEYGYQLFFSNFNGNWEQYVDSFAAAIPSGLNGLWFRNVGWPTAVPEQPFHAYVSDNQVWTDYYYNAYPMASSNDVKAAQSVKTALCELVAKTDQASPAAFVTAYNAMLKKLQNSLSQMAPTPIVSLAAADVLRRLEAPAVRPTGAPAKQDTSETRVSARPLKEAADA
jgi:hypothetical protein